MGTKGGFKTIKLREEIQNAFPKGHYTINGEDLNLMDLFSKLEKIAISFGALKIREVVNINKWAKSV